MTKSRKLYEIKCITSSIGKWEDVKEKVQTETRLNFGYKSTYWNSCGYCTAYMSTGHYMCEACPLYTTKDRRYKIPYCYSMPTISESIARTALVEAGLHNWRNALTFINILLEKMKSDLNNLKEKRC